MHPTSHSTSILLVGVGNEFRSDDGVGLLVARRIRDMNFPNVAVSEQSGEGTALIEAWSGADAVVLIDAVSSGAEPGTIHRIDIGGGVVPKDLRLYSSHAFGVSRAIALARSMNRLPSKMIVYGVEGRNFDFGSGLSTEVNNALGEVMELVMGEIVSSVEKSG